jgi:hypothetical protein
MIQIFANKVEKTLAVVLNHAYQAKSVIEEELRYGDGLTPDP